MMQEKQPLSHSDLMRELNRLLNLIFSDSPEKKETEKKT